MSDTERRRSDVFTPEQRSAVMARVRQKHTAPEMKLRRLLWASGRRYRLHRRDLPGSPDVVFPGRKLAIFVHGCFWHGHDCKHGSKRPKDNAGYWSDKLQKNRVRDARVLAELRARGWTGEVVWECELKNEAALSARLDALFG